MNTPQLHEHAFRPLSLPWKIVALVFIAAFLVIGVAGLILPIIPGVLFLFLAALLATRVSSRVARYAHNHPWFRQHLHHWHASGKLSMSERAKLALLLTARSCIKAVQALWRMALRSKR
ncbi:MAG TPA: DUF454 family protein [Pseudohongiella sp.]|nr:DUF454 family protein [Pseudohongiella sp.]